MTRIFKAVMDPAWAGDAGGGGRGAQNHFALERVDAIADQYLMHDTWDPKAEAALVFMWATAGAVAMKGNGNPSDATVLARRLWLRICATFVWVKVGKDARAGVTEEEQLAGHGGLGQWGRQRHEYLLICKRGKVPVPPPHLRPDSVIVAPRGVHSAKPELAWTQVIEPIGNACAPGVGIEYNARELRRGWLSVGRLDGENGPIVTRHHPDDDEPDLPVQDEPEPDPEPEDPMWKIHEDERIRDEMTREDGIDRG